MIRETFLVCPAPTPDEIGWSLKPNIAVRLTGRCWSSSGDQAISQTELPVTVTAGGELKQSVAPGELVMYLKQ